MSTKLQSSSPALFAMGDRAQQIGLEGTSGDTQAVTSMVDDIKARVDNLKKISDRKVKQCESVQKNREDFESFVNETMNWLDAKEEVLATCNPLDLDPQKVRSSLQKHQVKCICLYFLHFLFQFIRILFIWFWKSVIYS